MKRFIILTVLSILLPFMTASGISYTKVKPLSPGIRFIENKGQWEPQVLFRAGIPMGTLFLEKHRLTYLLVDPHVLGHCHHPGTCGNAHENEKPVDFAVTSHAFRMHFAGASENTTVSGSQTFKEYHNYFIGNDPSHWASDVKLYREITYRGLYPGIDMVVRGNPLHLKYEYLVAAGADPDQIRVWYEGTDAMLIEEGRLILRTTVNDVIEQQPFAYQLQGADTLTVPCRYILNGSYVSLSFPSGYNRELPLVIDPVVVASTYAGSMGSSTYGHSATYDDLGYIYTGGRSFGQGYPVTTGAFQTMHAGAVDIAISKFSPDGTSLIWATYVGGSSEDYAHSLVTNANQELFIYGSTQSTNYPVVAGCFQTVKSGQYDIVLTRLNYSGTALIGSTFIGGNASDGQNELYINYGDTYRGEVILDSQGNPCVASFSSSTNFPTTTGAFDQTHNGNQDGVVFKLDSTLTQLIWSTYLGGSGDDAAYGLKLNIVDMVYVAGGTQSTNFPTTPWVLHPEYQGGSHDGFMCIFMPDMTSMIACSYFGTPDFDEIFFIQMDEENNVYIYGQTGGTIPVTPPCYGNPGSHQFIVKLDQTLNGVIYSTVFGNGTQQGKLRPTAFLVDYCQNVYAAGWGDTQGFPVSPDAVQATTDGQDFYLIVLKKDAEEMLYATFYGTQGWEHVDGGTSRFDKNGIIYEAVCEGAANFPTTPGAYATYSTVGWDLAVFKIDFQLSGPTADIGVNPGTSGCAPFSASFVNNSTNAVEYLWNFDDGSPGSSLENPVHTFSLPGIYQVACIAIDSGSCFVSDTAYIEIHVLAPPAVTLGTDTLMCGTDSLVLDAGNAGNTFVWSTNATTQQITVTTPGTYWVNVNNGYCTGKDTIQVSFMNPPELGPDIVLCDGLSVTLDAGMTGYQYLWNSGQSTQSITVSTSQVYIVSVTQASCTLSDSVKVTFIPLPVVHLGPDQSLCEGETALLNAGNPGAFYSWNTGAMTQQINVYQSGIYSVTVTQSGCSGSDTVYINVLPVPQVNLLGDHILCEGDTLTLDAGLLGYQYSWSTGDTTQTVLVSDSGFYSVTVTASGCWGRDTVHVEMIILRVDLGSDTLLCPGQSIVLNAGNPGASYLWNTGDTIRTKTILNNGLYWVEVSKYLCKARDSIHVGMMQQVDLPDLLNLCGHEYLEIDAGIEADRYEWSDGQLTRLIRIYESGTYILSASKGHCILKDSTLVIGKPGISTFYIPNSFSPNHDGHNDRFLVKGTDIIYFNMKIFNRWGTMIHETNSIEEGWDGTYQGDVVMSGVYFYVIRYANECSFDQIFQEVGTVLVIR
ncbi:MAG TPA: gliding motility-associated C-terminal domain-containing protein [Bacteroidales bacterium]|nr:gliding motility-associated C-terminal domain-containing protein [Bacteroidales bacterium]HSA43241.1 gliding motility-associated C-terminal domain-containing protein [Bacteroidales bacterium]